MKKIIIMNFVLGKKRKFALKNILLLFAIICLTNSISASTNNTGAIKLEKNKFKIVFSEKEPGPLKIALEAFKKDFFNVMGFVPEVVNKMDQDNSIPEIVIVNQTSGALNIPSGNDKKLDGFESHRLFADSEANKIYLEGFDLRGTIYAIYTFSEKFLDVPPLHYWCSWVPVKKDKILIAGDCNIFFKSPQVRYRSILPGDQDFFNPWKKLSMENENVWLETVLRLKLNTVETYSTIEPGYKLTDYAYLIHKYGLVITS
ncbi:MAG TPA: hypothetical protein VKA38_01320, partial [Draconibacterium sp.]|nr:hypothetical protein [Draconibacterium sp.]